MVERTCTGRKPAGTPGHDGEIAAAEARAKTLGVPFSRLDSTTVDREIIEIVPEAVARRLRAIPLFRVENTLSVAMADPTDVVALDELRRVSNLNILPSLCLPGDLDSAFDRFYRVDSAVRSVMEQIRTDTEETEGAKAARFSLDRVDDGVPVVNLVNLILLQAIRDGASDIHIEPDDKVLRVRYRIDGVLREVHRSGIEIHPSLVSRIKTMAGMDIAEKRLPQDGRILVGAAGREIDLRASVLPTVQGEKICLRILDQGSLRLDLGEIGFPDTIDAQWREAVGRPDGVVLVTGPTGSGKTSTLYASLAEINSIERNIVTVEDPVEYDFPVINQVQVNPKAGLDFAKVLRSILRQDPDVIMVGEIRDGETAEIAVRAALTGHLVLSTLHTNDSVSAVTRLVDMGIPAYLVASSVRGILAQRLVRTICRRCREKCDADADLLQLAGFSATTSPTTWMGRGCHACGGTGYKGRTGLYEFLRLTRSLLRAVVRGADEGELFRIAIDEDALSTLREDGLKKVETGVTTLEEVVRVTRTAGGSDDDTAASAQPVHAGEGEG